MKKIRIITLLLLSLCFCSLFAAYYDSATGSGDTLKNQLKTIITNGHTPLSYDGAKLKLFQDVFKVDGVVRCIYTGQDFTIAAGYNGSTSPNTEHSYCQSWFGSLEPNTKKSDLHHLFPTVQNVNSSRGNMPYGIVTNHAAATTYSSYNDFHSFRGACSSGIAVFEPSDQYKGDIARGLLYFSVRYSMGLTIDNVDMLPYLLQWHSQDPVDAFEQSRNEKNYTFQGNRNPFIDHPEWVASIWQNSDITTTQISFDITSAITHEGKNTYFLAVRIINPSNSNPTSCRIAYNSGTSSAVNNFTYQDITFPANNSSTQFIPITVTDNNLVDGNRNVTFSLQNISGGNSASAGSNNQFTLIVEDNDFTETASSFASDLIISEYLEGSSSNKAIEIFNGTGSMINLNQYSLKLATNGAVWSTTTTLSGNLNHNDVYVVANNSANQNIINLADYSASSANVCNFNGNDAVGLFKNGTLIDLFGVYNGSTANFSVAGISSAAVDHTLCRKSSVKNPTTDWNISAGSNSTDSQWSVFSLDDISNLGSHTMDFGSSEENADIQAQLNIVELDTDYPFGNNTAITLNFSDLNRSGNVKVKKYNSGLLNPAYNTSTPEFVSQNRWIITKDNAISSFNASLIISLNDITSNDIVNPNSIKLYSRPTIGTGTFALIGNMIYNNTDNALSINDISSFSEFILCSDSQTLPVTLSSFTAINLNNTNNVKIDWQTESESNLIGYKLFRNDTNVLENSQPVSSLINAFNNSNLNQYSFLDNDLTDGDYYYWLSSYERNGNVSYYGPISVNVNPHQPDNPPSLLYQPGIVSIYPNPFNPVVNINYYLDTDSFCEISFYNSKGQLVERKLSGLQNKGLHSLNWKPSNLSSGIYFVKFSCSNTVNTRKILLLK